MKILGVDPGTVKTGFGIVDFRSNSFAKIYGGILRLSSSEDIPSRIARIYKEVDAVIKIHNPDQFAIETAFYGKNVQSAMKIGYARGAAILAAVHNNLPVLEYSPREVKKSVTGKGSATKEQVQFMVMKLMNITGTMIFDESDAFAIAICHAFKQNSRAPKSGNWKNFIEANPDRVM